MLKRLVEFFIVNHFSSDQVVRCSVAITIVGLQYLYRGFLVAASTVAVHPKRKKEISSSCQNESHVITPNWELAHYYLLSSLVVVVPFPSSLWRMRMELLRLLTPATATATATTLAPPPPPPPPSQQVSSPLKFKSLSHCSRRGRGRGGVRWRVVAEGGGGGVRNYGVGSPVRGTSILVVGGTGTLGRQIVRRALDEGYDVRCLVRPRPAPADFLRDWGATVVNADLTKPDTIPATLVGIHTVIDCATGRPEEPIKSVDWEGKVALIQCAKAMGIQKYVFYSIHNCDKHPEVPLMEIKRCTETFLAHSGLDHLIIRLCGFMQGLIGQYAVPILEEKSVWGTDAPTRIAYMDTQDIARLTFIALRNDSIIKNKHKLLTFAGPRAWTTQEVITLCERLAGQDANVTTVPVSILRLTRQLTRFFEWTSDVADRLAFSEVLTSDTVFSVPMAETYNLLGVDSKDIVSLEKYLQDYFTNILKKLKDLKAQSKQTDIYF
ncbi:hypothetical protein RIF29_18586 [Crotalaria pallida]|uniref:NmrA-like domain-containing protein n=1 Tax=Crotalaria pallida TaxID=3830 RepID=A0AAN9IGB6_CROPI